MNVHPHQYSFDLIGAMEPHWSLVLQEGKQAVKHVSHKVLTINPPKGVQVLSFSTQFKLLSHLSEGAHASFGEGKMKHFCLENRVYLLIFFINYMFLS